MGGVCPCFAGVDKAAGGKAAEPVKQVPVLSEKPTAPLIEKKPAAAPVEPKTLPPKDVAAIKPAAPAEAPAALAPPPAELAPPADAAPSGGGITEPLGMGSCLEVFSNSYGAWCPGVVYGLDSTSILVAYQVPGEPADANISTKTVAIDSTEVRVPIEDGCWLAASVEVYSHSSKAWCLGKVTENNGGILSVVFFYPNEPPDSVPVMKQLPLGDKDLRLRGIDAAFQFSTPAGLGHDTLEVNSAVEVFSNSLQMWCAGIVQELKDGVATIAFYYPDMDPSTEAPAIKDLPLGHQDLRLPGYATGAAYNTGPPVTEADLVVGGQIEVFSQSRKVWITSQVKEIADGMVTVLLRYPDMPPDSDLYEKVLPIGHGDMRLANGSTN
jgi:hypothetical protein